MANLESILTESSLMKQRAAIGAMTHQLNNAPASPVEAPSSAPFQYNVDA